MSFCCTTLGLGRPVLNQQFTFYQNESTDNPGDGLLDEALLEFREGGGRYQYTDAYKNNFEIKHW